MKYEEKVDITPQERKKIFLYVIVSFVLAYILMNVYAALQLPYGVIANLVFIGICGAGLYYAVRHGLCTYIYRIEDDLLLFVTNNGRYDKILCAVEIEKVAYIVRGEGKDIAAMRLNVAKSAARENCYTCVFTDADGKVYKLLFEPSETYIEKVRALGIEIR